MKDLGVKWNQTQLVKIIKTCVDPACAEILAKQKLDEEGVQIALIEGVKISLLAHIMEK